ncbi:hypothetical protein NQ317_008062 [Molorchus minor]|nr:hypothetical protein NQ317_008062 [Molorchus minor]
MDWNSIKKPPAQVFVHVTGTTFCERVRCTKFGTVICPVGPFRIPCSGSMDGCGRSPGSSGRASSP